MPFGINSDGTFDEIGARYDVGLGTRDGSLLNCKNKDASPVPIQRMAYMLSVDRRPSQYLSAGRVKTMREATELQEKAKLVQLGTSTTIDREFDQWVQNSQGDWSGGIGQRVYGLNGIENEYFDGEGLLWPLNDWIPQLALRGPTQGLPAATLAGPSGPDSGTETCAPGGALSVKQACAVMASFKAAGAVSRVGVLGAFTTGSNTAVAPPFGQATSAGKLLVAAVGGQRQQMSASADIGETGAATFSFDFSGVNSDNVIGTSGTFVVPAGGIYVNSISIYMGGHTAPVNTIFVIWNAGNGAVIANSGSFSAGTGRSLKTVGITQTFIAAGTSIRIGFWRQQNQDAEWGVASSGSFNYSTNVGWPAGQPGSGCTGPYVCGRIQAYASYTQLNVSDIVQSNSGTVTGWSKIKEQNSPDGYQQIQIWAKPNSGAGETAPAFAAAQGASPMHAALAEFNNIATGSPTDQTGAASNSLQTSITTTTPAIDSVAGDLVLVANRWSLSGAGTAGFSDSLNNGMAVVDMGDSGAASPVNHSSFYYGIVPSGAAVFTSWALNGTAGGYVEGLGMGYAVTYLDNQGTPHWHAAFFSGDQSYDVDLGANTGSKQGPLHMHVAAGYLWILFSEYPNANQLSVRMLGCAYGSNNFVQLRNDNITPTTAGSDGFFGLIAAGYVGGKLYVAVLQADQNAPPGSPTVNRNALYVLDYSGGTAVAPTGAAAAAVIFPFARGFKAVDLCWQASTLLLAVGDGLNAYVYSLNSPFSVVSTQAVIAGIANALLCAVGSTVFVVGWTQGPTGINRMDLYTLNGSTLTEVPFSPIVPFLDSVTSPQAYGGYAIWAVSYATPGGVAGQKTVTVYAYDVVKDRLFRALTFTDPSLVGSDIFSHDVIALFGVTTRTQAAGATFQSQLGCALFTGQLSNSIESAREFYWGVIPITPAPTFSGLLQLGVDITSGLFDFTAATNKLFRAVLSHFINGLVAGASTPHVTLDAWFDQDPNRLNAAPDFTVDSGTAPNPLPAQLDLGLFTNKVARKLVYRVRSIGGGYAGAGGWQNAPKITDVIVQAATGWVWDVAFDLSPYAVVNGAGQQEYAYTAQSPTDATSLSYDHVVAYNFLKKLWREKGGECTLYLPNGESYPALIQLLEFESPKPIAGIGRSDAEPTWQVICVAKIREDI